MIKNILKVIPILLVAFVMFTSDAKAGAPMNLNGYAWSETIGWVSFNGTDGGNVTVATTSATAGNISGYAWSENIGWISFQNGDASHPNPTMDLSSGVVNGWARACAGTVNGDCISASRTDGWDGWIELSGSNHASISGLKGIATSNQGVSYNNESKAFSGYAWGSDVVGWLSFDSGIAYGNPVICTDCGPGVGNSSLSCSITAVSPTATQVNVNYTINNDPNKTNYKLTRNTGTVVSGISTGQSSSYVSSTYNDTGLTPNTTYTYSISTSTIPLCSSVPVTTIAGGGGTNASSSAMWVDNDKTLTTTKISIGKKAKINWEIPSTYSCTGYNVSGLVVPGWSSLTTTTSQISAYPTQALTTVGIYNIGMHCTDSVDPANPVNKDIGPVKIIVSDSSLIEI